MNRKGFALVMVLVIATVIASTTTLLWSTTNIEMKITGNKYRISQAKMAAQSGINHFMLINRGTKENIVEIEETSLSKNTSYKVDSFEITQDKILIISSGYYIKNKKRLFEYPIKVVMSK